MLYTFYSFFFEFAYLSARIVALFFPKLRVFLKQRESISNDLKHFKKEKGEKVFWFHAASMGEFEQIIPLLTEIKKSFPKAKCVVSFFSPSGYEIFHNTPLADAVSYLPLDRSKDLNTYLDKIQPDCLLLVKYEFWPNLLKVVAQRKVPIYSISSTFRKEQLFFRSLNFGMRSVLKKVNRFFVLNKNSKELLNRIQFSNVDVTGDLRFDRVIDLAEAPVEHSIINDFLGEEICCIAGSTWPEDHALFLPYLDKKSPCKWIIAPHKVDETSIATLEKTLPIPVAKWSSFDKEKDASKTILIIDCIGVLATAYSYGDIAYVGGGMGTKGLHNTLEAAVFGLPIIIGKNYKRYPEANLLIENGGMFSVSSKKEFGQKFYPLVQNKAFRQEKGKANQNLILAHKGSTQRIISFLKTEFNGR